MFRRLTSCRPPLRLLALGCLLLSLSACGQKGPLYLPDETEQDKKAEQSS